MQWHFHRVVLDTHCSLIDLEFRSVGFVEGGKLENLEKLKPSLEQGREPATNSTQIYLMPDLGIKSGAHWWDASALTTVPPLLSI